MGEKGGIQSPFSTDERGNRPTPFFSLSRFLFFSSYFLILLLVPRIVCFFLRPHPSREKKSSSSKDEKVYSYPLDAIPFCFLFFRGAFRGFFFFLTFSCLYPFDDEGCKGKDELYNKDVLISNLVSLIYYLLLSLFVSPLPFLSLPSFFRSLIAIFVPFFPFFLNFVPIYPLFPPTPHILQEDCAFFIITYFLSHSSLFSFLIPSFL